jgi:hypothetical protein
MSTYNVLLYDPTTKEVVSGPAPNPFPNGTQYSDYLFWNPTTSQWAVGSSEVHVGIRAGQTQQGSNAIAIGGDAGTSTQGIGAIAIGAAAGAASQGLNAIAIGTLAGQTSQGIDGTIAIGLQAGQLTQGAASIAIGVNAGRAGQLSQSIAIGIAAGTTNQQNNAIAIGRDAGQNNQGTFTIAIGMFTGVSNQPNNTIIMGATGGTFNVSNPNACYVSPLRSATTGNRNLLWNTGSGEITTDTNLKQMDPNTAQTAGSGYVGEVRGATNGPFTGLSSGIDYNLTSVILTPGLWLVWGRADVSNIAPSAWRVNLNPSNSNVAGTMHSLSIVGNPTGEAMAGGTVPIMYYVSTNTTFTTQARVLAPFSTAYTISGWIQAVRFA